MIESQLTPSAAQRSGRGGFVAPGAAGLLGLAATPVFAVMALWTVFFGAQTDAFCAIGGGMRMNGMALMYALMSVFHVAPWLTLLSISTHRSGDTIEPFCQPH